MTEEELLAEVERLRGEVACLRSAVAQIAQHVLGGQIDGLLSMFGQAQDASARYTAVLDNLASSSREPFVPLRPSEDTLPRGGRNPRIFCEQYESGTWIHGRPHNCPPWARR